MACELCGLAIESISHVLRDCIVAKNFWKLLGIPSKHHDFFLLDLKEWMKVNCSSKSTLRHHHLPWKIVFPFGIWQLWNQRNSFLFSSGTVTRNIQDHCIKKSAEFFAIVGDKPNKNLRTNIQVKWTKPPVGWLKLNTDGFAVGNPGIAGGGGLIHNENGDWIMGLAKSLGITSGVIAKLWALKDGLTLASQLRIADICVELDAELIVLLLNNYSINNLMLELLLGDYRTLLKKFHSTNVQHISREANQCANALVKFGATLSSDFVNFVNPPPVVEDLLAFDKAKLFCNRLIST